MLEDVQERLVYRTQVYVRTEILGYKPSPGDIAYPEKLEMMQVDFREKTKSNNSIFFYFVENCPIIKRTTYITI
jgi:hypothetical protein